MRLRQAARRAGQPGKGSVINTILRLKLAVLASFAAAMTCLPTSAAAEQLCHNGKNGDLCINFSKSVSGNTAKVHAFTASVRQGCGHGGDFHMDVTIQSNDAVIKPSWQKLPGINKYTIPGPQWIWRPTGKDCQKNKKRLTVFDPMPPDEIKLSWRSWPRGYYICAVLWNYHGNGNFSQDNVACKKL